MERTPPLQMAKKLARQLRSQRPDYSYLKQVFSHTRKLLNVSQDNTSKRLPQLLTDEELAAFYDAVFSTRNPTHMVMIKLLIFTGIRNAELAKIRLADVDLPALMIRIERGKGKKDRLVPIPLFFRGELAVYIESQTNKKATYLFESNRKKPASNGFCVFGGFPARDAAMSRFTSQFW